MRLLSGCFDATGAVRLERSAPGLGVLGDALARQVEIVHDAAGAEIWGAPVEPALLASIAYTCGFDRGTPGDEKVEAVALDDWEHGWQSPLRQAVWDSFAGQKVKANGELVHGAPLAEFGAALDAWIADLDVSAPHLVRKTAAVPMAPRVAPQEDDWWVEELDGSGLDNELQLNLCRIGATNELAVNLEATFVKGNHQWQTKRIALHLRRARATPPSILVPLSDTMRPGVKVEFAPGQTLTLECRDPQAGQFQIEAKGSVLPSGFLFKGDGQRIVKVNPDACHVIMAKAQVRRRDLRQEGEPVSDDLVVEMIKSLQLAATLNGNRAEPGEAVQEIAIITVAERTFGIVKKEKA